MSGNPLVDYYTGISNNKIDPNKAIINDALAALEAGVEITDDEARALQKAIGGSFDSSRPHYLRGLIEQNENLNEVGLSR